MERVTGYPGQQVQISHSFKNPDNSAAAATVTSIPVFRLTSPEGQVIVDSTYHSTPGLDLPEGVTPGQVFANGAGRWSLLWSIPEGATLGRYRVEVSAKVGGYDIVEEVGVVTGRFHIYYGTSGYGLIKTFSGLEFNTMGGAWDLVTSGKLRLTIEIPTPENHNYPFGDQRGWQILYSTDNYLDGYASSPALANKYFPAAGITSPLPNAYFRIAGELRMGEGLRPVLTDMLVKYTS